jgi:hypothetical protein
VLAFSDEALALLMIAAGRIQQRRRGEWLRATARKFEPTPNAVRLARARQRQDNGVAYYRLQLDAVAVEQLLVREGYLLDGRDYERTAVETALADFITRLCDMHVGTDSSDGQ